jgi:phosphopantothenoylcysteine decarboxylase / phosphopantothenate---cysteine ligase
VKANAHKISSDLEEIEIRLKRNPKLVNNLKEWSRNKGIKLVAFKLTSFANESQAKSAVHKLGQNSDADLIVHNDFQDIQNEKHQFHIFGKDFQMITTLTSANGLAQYLGAWATDGLQKEQI